MVDDLFMMELKNAAVEDSGEYSITASNEHGSVRASVTVQVGAGGKREKSFREEVAEAVEVKKSFKEETSSTVTQQKQTFEADISLDSAETSFQQEDISVEAVVGVTGQPYVRTDVYAVGNLVGPKEEGAPSERPRNEVDGTEGSGAQDRPKLKEEISADEESDDSENVKGIQQEVVTTKRKVVKKVSKTRQQSDLDSEDRSEITEEEVSEERTVTTRTITEGEEEIDVTTERKTKRESTMVEESGPEQKGEKPTMPIKPESVSVCEGETIVLKCRVKG